MRRLSFVAANLVFGVCTSPSDGMFRTAHGLRRMSIAARQRNSVKMDLLVGLVTPATAPGGRRARLLRRWRIVGACGWSSTMIGPYPMSRVTGSEPWTYEGEKLRSVESRRGQGEVGLVRWPGGVKTRCSAAEAEARRPWIRSMRCITSATRARVGPRLATRERKAAACWLMCSNGDGRSSCTASDAEEECEEVPADLAELGVALDFEYSSSAGRE